MLKPQAQSLNSIPYHLCMLKLMDYISLYRKTLVLVAK